MVISLSMLISILDIVQYGIPPNFKIPNQSDASTKHEIIVHDGNKNTGYRINNDIQPIAIIPYTNNDNNKFRTTEFYYQNFIKAYAFRVYDISTSGVITYPDTITVIMFYYNI